MAYTSIWKIDSRLDKVLNYTTNEIKTAKENYQDLHNLIDYVGADYKTEKQFYVTGINCLKETALEEMILTKNQYGKNNGIQGFHIIQSCKENELTPELAHQVGIELANELFGDRFEVIVSTHLNTNHIHNHIVINSVSFKDGKRYYDNYSTYAMLRKTSDLICEEKGLSVIKDKKVKIDYTKFYEGRVVKSNYYTITKDDIDFAIKQAYSYQDFLKILKKMNYEVFFRANKISVRRDPYRRNIRIERAFGEKYSIENIKKRVFEEYETRTPFVELRGNTKHYFSNKKFITNYKNNKPKGIYRLVLHYCYLLKVFPKVYPKKYMSPELRADIKKLDKRLNQCNWLCERKITSTDQLFNYRKNLSEELNNLKGRRENCYLLKRRKNNLDKSALQKEIEVLTDKINYIKSEVRKSNEIEETIPKIKDNLKSLKDTKKERSREKDDKFK